MSATNSPTSPPPVVDPELGVPVHSAAAELPLIVGDDFDRLVEDIRSHGVIHPITLDAQGVLLDGRNRLRAAIAAGRGDDVPRRVMDVTGDAAIAFIFSANEHRRHLTQGQRAMMYALVHPDAQHGGLRVVGTSSIVEHGPHRGRVSVARAVLRHDRAAALDVMAGRVSLEMAKRRVDAELARVQAAELARQRAAAAPSRSAPSPAAAPLNAAPASMRASAPHPAVPLVDAAAATGEELMAVAQRFLDVAGAETEAVHPLLDRALTAAVLLRGTTLPTTFPPSYRWLELAHAEVTGAVRQAITCSDAPELLALTGNHTYLRYVAAQLERCADELRDAVDAAERDGQPGGSA